MAEPVKKVRWADMEDEEDADPPLPEPQKTRHGVKVTYVPPHLRTKHQLKTSLPSTPRDKK